MGELAVTADLEGDDGGAFRVVVEEVNGTVARDGRSQAGEEERGEFHGDGWW